MFSKKPRQNLRAKVRALLTFVLLTPFLFVSIVVAPSAHALCTTAPTNVVATYASSSTATISWTAPTPCSGVTISNYTVRRTQSGSSAVSTSWSSGSNSSQTASGTPYTFTSLSSSKYYGFYVVANYSDGGKSAAPSSWVASSGAMSNSLYTGSVLTGLTSTFSAVTRTTTGFTVNVTNYSTSYTYTVSASNGAIASKGAASGSTLPITVSGLAQNASSTLTVTTARSGYSSVPATQAGQALTLATVTIGSVTPTLTGATYTVSTTGIATLGTITVSDTTNPARVLTNNLASGTYTIGNALGGDAISISVAWGTPSSGYTVAGPTTASTTALIQHGLRG